MATASKPVVELNPVESSSLAAVGYYLPTMTLAVKFKNSDIVHHYEEVTPKKWEQMQAAESMGSFFANKVRNEHPHSIVEADVEA
jgi:hypothetical protein